MNKSEKLDRIIESSSMIAYESPNITPILRYKCDHGYNIALLGNDASILVCLKWLLSEGIKPYCLISENVKVRNMPSYSFEQFCQQKKRNSIVILALKDKSEMKKYQNELEKLEIEEVISAYDLPKVPLMNEEYFGFLEENKERMKEILNLLSDEESQDIYLEYIRSKYCLDFYRLEQTSTYQKYFDPELMSLTEQERIINLGCSNGDTLFYYLAYHHMFQSWQGFDIDEDRLKQFQNNTIILPEEIRNKIKLNSTNIGLNHKLDDLVEDEVSLITMDIEGEELNALKGASKLIQQNTPILSISAYHKPSDLIDLPIFIKRISPDYELYFRKYASTFRNKFRNAELVLYGIPKRARIKK